MKINMNNNESSGHVVDKGDDVTMCWHHPHREAVAVTNLGMAIDLDTPVCQKCLDKVGLDKLVRRISEEQAR